MRGELGRVIEGCRPALAGIGLLSGASNVLALTGSIFMLAVYDRVIPSGSVETLIALGLLALLLYSLQGLLDVFRGRMLTRVGLVLKESFSARSYDVIVRNAAQGDLRAGQAVQDMDQVQGFLSSLGPTALFDLPWLPIYVAICFAFHFYIGLAVCTGALVLILLTALGNSLNRRPSLDLNEKMIQRANLLTATQSHADTIQALGMTTNMSAKWTAVEAGVIWHAKRIADVTTTLGNVSRIFRMILQSFVLAIGALLVIRQDATGGIMIASSILSARALAPIELSIAHWKGFLSFRQSWRRLDDLLNANPPAAVQFAVAPPEHSVTAENLSVALPNSRRLVVRDVSFQLRAGHALGIVGPAGSGKSSLARALVGMWPAALGAIRVDQHLLSRWTPTERGRFIGYLPQSVALFEGTIAENISRFDPNPSEAEIVRVARAAGVHQMIARLPDGYDTRIAENGMGLSGGQAQRVALARALYGDPFLTVLDEPNSNLDADGEGALQLAIQGVKNRAGIVVIIAHRPSVLSHVDFIMIVQDGRMLKFGPQSEILDLMGKREISQMERATTEISAPQAT